MEWFQSSFAYWPTKQTERGRENHCKQSEEGTEQPTQTIRTSERTSFPWNLHVKERNNNGRSVNGNGGNTEHTRHIKKLSFSSWFSHLHHFHSFTHSFILLRWCVCVALCVWVPHLKCEHFDGAHSHSIIGDFGTVGQLRASQIKLPTIHTVVWKQWYAHSKLPEQQDPEVRLRYALTKLKRTQNTHAYKPLECEQRYT